MAESILYATNGAQVVVAQQANLRQGTADTKERAEVAGSTKKLWRQKGTGRARIGSGKSPHWRGGGTAFGPHPRDYSLNASKKIRRNALASLLADRLQEGRFFVLNELKLDSPKTKEIISLLRRLNIAKSCLIVTEAPDKNAHLSARNIPGVDQTYVDSLSALDVISHENLVLTKSALETLEKKLS
jgi:large subunit ribosomal protein L4